MNCPKCRCVLNENQKFCTNCGYSLKPGGSFFDNEDQKWDYIRAWIYTITTILIFGILIWILC